MSALRVETDTASGADVPLDRSGCADGRYKVVSSLQRDRVVETFSGVDQTDGSPVIIKAIDSTQVSAAVHMRLEHESRILESIDDGKQRRLLWYGYQGPIFWLVQPRLDAHTLRHLLTRGSLDVATTLAIARSILHTLQLAHGSGVLHRDVKPQNVGLDALGTPGSASLFNFSPVPSGEHDSDPGDTDLTSLQYLAPEAAGLINVVVDQRADLYSLGIVLFECLAGRPPFVGDTVGEVLRQHLSDEVPQLRSLGLPVPRALDGMIQRLLAKDPTKRYQHADSALRDVIDIMDSLAMGCEDPVVTLGRDDRRHSLTEPSFVGRSTELLALTKLLDELPGGQGGLVLLEAESGAGKSRLLDEVALLAGQRDIWVLRGQGVDQAAQRPFRVLDGVVAALVERDADALPGAGIRKHLGDWAGAVAAALPGLTEVLGTTDQLSLGPEAYGETRSIDALSALLEVLGHPGQPTILLLDDCQWADAMTIDLLAKWQSRRISEERGFVLIVAAFRSEEVPTGHPLRSIDALTTVTLAPIMPLDIEALSRSMAGPLPEDAISAIVRLADGSPFMASAVLRGMVETGALHDSAHGWEIDPGPMQDVQTSRRAALFLSRRFDLLDPEAMRFLTVGAILGKEFELVVAVALSDQSTSDVMSALDEARRRRILWVDDVKSRCSFTHDKLRETILERLEDGERRALHRRAADIIESIDPSRVFELAYHFDASDSPDRALPYALDAAELARGRNALDVAVTHYRIADRAVRRVNGGDDPGLAGRVVEGIGDVLTLQGDYLEAEQCLARALSLTSDPLRRAVLDSKLGNIAFKRGDQANARKYLEGALRDLGRWVPKRWWSQLVGATVQVFVQAWHTVLPKVFLSRRSPDGAEREFAAIRIYSRLAYVYWFSAGKVPCAWAHLREMNLAERYPPSSELAQAYSSHAPVMTMIPWYSRGLAYAKRSLEIRRDLGDVWGQAQSLNFYGVVLYASSRYQECIEACRESARLLRHTGDRWEQNTATWHEVFSHYRLGELPVACEMARELYYTASAIGDVTAAGIALSGWARSGMGIVPEAFVAVELGRDLGDAQTSAEVHLADGLRLFYAGDVEGAIDRFSEANRIVGDAGLRQEYIAPVKPWLATALRTLAEGTDSRDPRFRRRRIRRAARAARQADRLSRSYRNNRPHALRERALVAVLQGHPAKARRFLERSMTVSELQGADYESALTRVASAHLSVRLGEIGAGEELATFDGYRMNLEPRPTNSERSTLSLTDRFEMLLEIGRRIGSATSPAAVYKEVYAAALQLLRGDYCIVIPSNAKPDDRLSADAAGVDREGLLDLMALATVECYPVVSGAMTDSASTDTMLLAAFRSALCAPIICDGQVVASFLVTHHQVDDLFGDVEIQMAEFIATLAGAALEHLAGSEARFRSLVQSSSDVITIVDRNGTITYQSSSVAQVFGHAPEELVGLPLASWLHPDDAGRLLSFLDAPSSDIGAEGHVQTRMRHSDGSWRVGESTVRCLFDDPGVEGLVLNTRDASERVALESELRLRATHDPLTGLANRALFVDRVHGAFARRFHRRYPIAVVFLDLDDFKSINDSMGHAVGDGLLKVTGERLERCIRPHDTVARWGGDEFAILLEDADAGAAEHVVKRILAELERPYRIGDREVLQRASMGVAVTQGDETSDDLLIGADLAMYAAKSKGKAGYVFCEAAMRDAAVDRSVLRNDLEWALQREELEIHYQPIVDLPSGDLSGFEALVRWNHPVRGLLMPDDWIDLAEESGLIISIGGWVLRNACDQASAWQHIYEQGFTMAVNVSARQLQSAGLFAELSTALERSGLPAESLILEITESATVVDTEGVIARLEALKTLGVGLSIDDFGTGYSSLSYLRRFPVDHLKVDRSFVAEVASNPEDLAIVASVINLGHSLGLSVVAEGVESEEQRIILCDMGCDQAQGFKWCHPVGADKTGQWLSLVGSP